MQDILLQLLPASITWQRYEGGCEFPEVIITNYDPGERERSKPRQLDLFGMWGDGETDHYEIREEICPEREVL